MLTERKYRVDKYLEMARLTNSPEKKENFVDMACYYLESKEFDGTLDIESSYFENKEREDIINIPRANLYAEYVSTCEEKGEIVNSQVKFYREIEHRYKVKVKKSSVGYVDGVRKRAWVYN